jgi:hypothetical protein
MVNWRCRDPDLQQSSQQIPWLSWVAVLPAQLPASVVTNIAQRRVSGYESNQAGPELIFNCDGAYMLTFHGAAACIALLECRCAVCPSKPQTSRSSAYVYSNLEQSRPLGRCSVLQAHRRRKHVAHHSVDRQPASLDPAALAGSWPASLQSANSRLISVKPQTP